jgi:tankyrase
MNQIESQAEITCKFEACKVGNFKRVQQLVTKDNVNDRDPNSRKSTCLHYSAGYGRKDICKYLLIDCQADPSVKDEGGLQPIHNAASFGHVDVLHLLISNGADINATDNWGWTPLHEACVKKKVDIIQVLLNNNAELSLKNQDGKTPVDLSKNDQQVSSILCGEYRKNDILEAARTGNEDKLKQLLTPVNVNCRANDDRKSTPLHLASGYNMTSIVQLLLDRGANVNAKDNGGLIALHNACSYGHFEVAKILIDRGALVNEVDMWSFTPLHEAVIKQRHQICSLLLCNKGRVDIHNCYKKTCLHLAKDISNDFYQFILIESMGSSIVDIISSEGATLNQIKDVINGYQCEMASLFKFKHFITNKTLLQTALTVKKGEIYEIIKYFIETSSEDLINNETYLPNNSKPLHLAVETCDIKIVQLILNSISLDQKKEQIVDSNGDTPLHYAAKLNEPSICKLLIDAGFDINWCNYSGKMPHDLTNDPSLKSRLLLLQTTDDDFIQNQFKKQKELSLQQLDVQSLIEASKSGDLEVVKRILISKPNLVNCCDTDGRLSTPLHFASGYNHFDICEYLLRMNANVLAVDKGRLQPLHNAASYGHENIIKLLLKSGADVNAQDIYMFTPLHEATLKKKYEICRILIEHGANVNLKNSDGESALDLAGQLNDEDLIDILRGETVTLLAACKSGNFKKVKQLVNESNINCVDENERSSTPLHLAAGYNYIDIAEYLLKMNANIQARDKGGLIPLHNAASYGHLEMVHLLIKHKPSIINITDKWGYSCLHEAAQKGRSQVCALLIAHGIDPTIRNKDNKTALDLVINSTNSDDVKALLTDAMPVSVKTLAPPYRLSCDIRDKEQWTIAGADNDHDDDSVNFDNSNKKDQNLGELFKKKSIETGDGCMLPMEESTLNSNSNSNSIQSFLEQINEINLLETFNRECVTFDILCEMNHKDLKEIGISTYGTRHKILQGIKKYSIGNSDCISEGQSSRSSGSNLIELKPETDEYSMVEHEVTFFYFFFQKF